MGAQSVFSQQAGFSRSWPVYLQMELVSMTPSPYEGLTDIPGDKDLGVLVMIEPGGATMHVLVVL